MVHSSCFLLLFHRGQTSLQPIEDNKEGFLAFLRSHYKIFPWYKQFAFEFQDNLFILCCKTCFSKSANVIYFHTIVSNWHLHSGSMCVTYNLAKGSLHQIDLSSHCTWPEGKLHYTNYGRISSNVLSIVRKWVWNGLAYTKKHPQCWAQVCCLLIKKSTVN